MNLVAECNDFRLGHCFFLVANRVLVNSQATALRFRPAALLTITVLELMVVLEADTVRADAIGNYAEFLVTVGNVCC
jgi:hypothetical protein